LEYRLSEAPAEGELWKLAGAVGLVKVDETKWEPSWDALARGVTISAISATAAIGRRLKYLFKLGERVVGAIGFSFGGLQARPQG
jgi:hypothetical protein